MSAPALALSFFDPAHETYGTARAGASILFEGRRPRALGGASIEPSSEGGWRCELDGELALDAEVASDAVDLGGVSVRLVHVHGEAAGRRVECLGTLAETADRAALGRARRPAHGVGDRRRGARAAGARAAAARRARPRRGADRRRAARRGALPAGRRGAALDRLRRRRPPAQRRASSCGCTARSIRGAGPGSWSPDRRSSWRRSRCTPPSSAGASTAATASAATS